MVRGKVIPLYIEFNKFKGRSRVIIIQEIIPLALLLEYMRSEVYLLELDYSPVEKHIRNSIEQPSQDTSNRPQQELLKKGTPETIVIEQHVRIK